jgi:hypothetical protein
MADKATVTVVLERTKEMREYMLGAIHILDRVIHEVESKGGPNGPMYGYPGIQRDLKIIKARYSRVYKEEFSSLDEDTLINLGCLGVIDLFESDLLSRLKTTRSRMWIKYSKVVGKINELNNAVQNTDETSTALRAVNDPTLRRYIDRTSTNADLIENINQATVAWEVAFKPVTGASVVNLLSRWQDSILNAQYPLSSRFCSDDQPISQSLDEKAAEEIKQREQKRAKEQQEAASAYSSTSTDFAERIRGMMVECRTLLNKLDSSYFDDKTGRWTTPNRALANSYRSEVAMLEGQVPAISKISGVEYTSRSEALLAKASALLQRIKTQVPG